MNKRSVTIGCSAKARKVWQKRLLGAALLSASIAVAGCGAAPDASSEEVGSTTQAINPPEGWRIWTVAPGSSDTFTGDAGICLATPDGVGIVGRSSNSGSANRYRMIMQQWRVYNSWADISTTTLFNSKPACTALDEVSFSPPPRNNQIAIVGKRENPGSTSSHNKFYVKTMLVDTDPGEFGTPPSQPTIKVNWSKISDDVYSSAAGVTVAYGQLMVVGRRSTNRLWLHRNTLSTSTTDPFSNSNWLAAIQVPQLPGGWTAAGDPVIANTVPIMGVVTLMTRATSNGVSRLYYIFWDGSVFWDGLTINAWGQVPTGTTVIRSDPALEVDVGGTTHANLVTVFIRGETNIGGTVTNQNRIFQASGFANLWENFTIVRPQENYTFTGAPAAVGSGNFEGWHWVVAKRVTTPANQFWSSTPVPF